MGEPAVLWRLARPPRAALLPAPDMAQNPGPDLVRPRISDAKEAPLRDNSAALRAAVLPCAETITDHYPPTRRPSCAAYWQARATISARGESAPRSRQVVGVAEMADAEELSEELAEAHAVGNVERRQREAAERIRIVPFRQQYRRDGGRILLRVAAAGFRDPMS